jgi:hypothetical protein
MLRVLQVIVADFEKRLKKDCLKYDSENEELIIMCWSYLFGTIFDYVVQTDNTQQGLQELFGTCKCRELQKHFQSIFSLGFFFLFLFLFFFLFRFCL